MIANLLSNAIPFTEGGTISLRASLELGEFPLVVSDTGLGIGGDRPERIIESFRQADDSTTLRFAGTGLGLTNSRPMRTILERFVLRAAC